MPNNRETATTPLSDAEVTAISATVVRGSAGGGYGDRFEDDSFDYPAPSPAHAWSAEAAAAHSAGTTVAESDSESGNVASGSRRSPPHDESRWRQTAVRHRLAVTTVAALALLAGFGLALSTVSDTVTSTPNPGGTARGSAPRSPDSPPLPPTATPPTEPSGTGVSAATAPTETVPPPVTGDLGDDHGEEERGREDDDHADD